MYGRRTWRAAIVGMTMVAAGLATCEAETTGLARDGPEAVRLLDVPYVPQTEALCGGAAVAMVQRFWGDPAVVAEDYAPLLAPGSNGIRTEVLVAAVRARGWTALPVTGNAPDIQAHLAAGRPVIALIAVGPTSFHYVVLLAWVNGGVILHDPATAPFRTRTEQSFDDAWARSGRWALLVLPATVAADSVEAEPPAPPARAPTSGSDSPTSGPADSLRNLAGVRFTAEDWAGAAELAERSLAIEPEDAYTWRLLAGSRFLLDDEVGALRAWNEISEPRADLARIDGLDRIRYRTVADQLDLPAGGVLTARAFVQARRRLDEIPAQAGARLRLRPLPNGIARLDAAVFERPLVFDGPLDAGAMGVKAVVDRELSLRVASPMGHGELWTVGYRWPRERPRVTVELAIPGAGGRPGIWRVEGSWERQTYAADEVSPSDGVVRTSLVREERRRSALSFADWLTADLRVEVGAALDGWVGRGDHVALSTSLDRRFADDRLALTARGGQWMSLADGPSFQAGDLGARWNTRQFVDGGWQARLGVAGASANAPLALWSGAGTGQGRAPLLRAHPLLDQGVLDGRVFGRSLVHAGVERHEWAWTRRPVRVGWSLFVDGARAIDGLQAAVDPWQVDGGASVRIAGPRGEVRIAAAYGLVDGGSALSIAWFAP